MGETLRSFGAWFKDDMIPYSIMRRFAIQLILALDYAHEEKVIHTDIQPANIFVRFRDTSLIESDYLAKVPLPKQDRSEEQYTPIPSYPLRAYYFSGDDWKNFHEFDIALGDWDVASWADKHLCEVIQPVALRAPEVLIRAPWDSKTDWWNLGAVIYEVYRCFRMFDGRCPPGRALRAEAAPRGDCGHFWAVS
jgi:serine/threonine-protein kinase SRPK3